MSKEKWQPIKTCPDEASVLLLLPGLAPKQMAIGYKGSYIRANNFREITWVISGHTTSIKPTHWMALPKLPASVPQYASLEDIE